MLLMELKNEEKFAFLGLAYYVANIDGEFEKQEKDIIEDYCTEMGIDNIEYNMNDFNFEETLSKIKTPKSQKIVILELMILIHCDDKFHRFEQNVIDKIANYYEIPQNKLNIYSQWGKMTSALYLQGKMFLEEEI
ncbi:MAG: TerB family tellurite resistance protein [Sulfurimonas sp.]|uniref:tellurite resistance TerB family protein n=1 Tax=Sulfurimonas sp. TaxID=2022749 RepID=UPI00262C1857|nr:TerB family tellurite resistance protein [Sulfurimonas sp.]MCW8895826.1 TerB family tellurite resistance protein [Sulfurimonas sp.]MCW8954896.1 TerB family tellurite resistance protein [Sulfurimonas sp.]MCW9067823.1 TerB family tellurite resistance protein [Sulfurimonas sp.]